MTIDISFKTQRQAKKEGGKGNWGAFASADYHSSIISCVKIVVHD